MSCRYTLKTVEKLIWTFLFFFGLKGTLVAVAEAIDVDDPKEGDNAKLIYSLDKNVIDEETGEAIFVVDPSTGEIRTSLCCLDREKTHNYNIQVVASDGGGLKGILFSYQWRHPSLSELTPIIFNMELTHLS